LIRQDEDRVRSDLRSSLDDARAHFIQLLDSLSDEAFQLLDTIRPEEWAHGGRAYGEGYWTVEHALRHQREHVDEHIRQIHGLLSRAER
jgi:hypothetical protein